MLKIRLKLIKLKKKKHFFSIEKFYNHPKIMLTVILTVTLFFASQFPRLRLDNNNFRFIPKNNQARITAEKISSVFGDEVPILIGIQRKFSSVLDKDFLTALRAFDKKLQGINLVKSTVSLAGTTYIGSENGSVVTKPLISEDFSGYQQEIFEIKNKLRSWDLYSNSLISDNLRSTQVLVFLDIKSEASGEPETIAACREIMKLADEWVHPDMKIYVTGIPVFSEVVNEAAAHDLAVLIPIVLLVVIVILFFSFRRFTGVFLPFLTVIISVTWAIGAMGLFSVPLSILSTVLPVILIAVGSAYGIHVINHYYDEVVQGKTISDDEHKRQIVRALSEVIRPVFLAALTTFAGFFSFCFTSVVPIFEFGVFSSFGVIAAFAVSITLIPSILILRGPKEPSIKFLNKKEKIESELIKSEEEAHKVDKILASTFVVLAEHRRSVIIAALICIMFSISGIKRLVIDNVLMEYFDPETQIIKADMFLQKEFGGSKLLNILISSDEEGRVIMPDVLAAVDSLSQYLTAEVPEVGKVTCITDLIKKINQVMNSDEPAEGIRRKKIKPIAETEDFGDFGFDDESDNYSDEVILTEHTESKKLYSQAEIFGFIDKAIKEADNSKICAADFVKSIQKQVNYEGAAYYEIPSDPQKYGKQSAEELKGLIANYLILLAGNTKGFIDNIYSPKALKINVQLKTVGQKDSDIALQSINEFIKVRFPKDIKVETGGFVLIEKSLNNLVVQSQLISVGISLFVVFLILSVYYSSLAAGILGIIPLSISILMNFGFMGMLGIKLNIGTAMVASFAIGIGVDYTIHYLAAYHKCFLCGGDDRKLLYNTFLGSGKAILFNAASVGAGFAVLMLSNFNMLAELGFLIMLIMFTSSLGSLTILPVLLMLFKPKFVGKVLRLTG